MKILQIIGISVFLSLTISLSAQVKVSEFTLEIQEWQERQNKEFRTPNESPLTKEGLSIFKGLDFYKVNLKFRVEAVFKRTPYEPVFGMSTTTSRLPEYKKYGIAIFKINNIEYKLNVYQNQKAKTIKGYENHLFIPYMDLTSGNSSYSGGRYIDLLIPNGDILIIDFNKSYNPYCAYNHKYSCPIPPSENSLNVRIEAGVMRYKDLQDKIDK